MTATPTDKVSSYLAWLPLQKQPMTHDHLVETGSVACLISRDQAAKLVTMLLTHDYLHMGEDLNHMPRYSLDRPRLVAMKQSTRDELIQICSSETTQLPRPGAPAGNTNALKHGRYSARFNPMATRPAAGYTIDGEIALVTSILETLASDDAADVNLLLKAATTLARLKVAAAAMASRIPPDPQTPATLPSPQGETNGHHQSHD